MKIAAIRGDNIQIEKELANKLGKIGFNRLNVYTINEVKDTDESILINISVDKAEKLRKDESVWEVDTHDGSIMIQKVYGDEQNVIIVNNEILEKLVEIYGNQIRVITICSNGTSRHGQNKFDELIINIMGIKMINGIVADCIKFVKKEIIK